MDDKNDKNLELLNNNARGVEQFFTEPLTPADIAEIEKYALSIDVNNSSTIMSYGAVAQRKMADFSESVLSGVTARDLGEVGKVLSDMISELRNFEVDSSSKGFFKSVKKIFGKVASIKDNYNSAMENIEKISSLLQEHQARLLKDVAMLDQMYELNKSYFREITMYIEAGKKKLADINNNELVELRDKAERSGKPEDAQEVKDLLDKYNRFEKKIHDLELTKAISLQMGPQIRMIQSNDIQMSEKIQSTMVNTIPLWKSQMVLAVGISHSQEAASAQKRVSDMTNELLKKNAETLKIATIETAKENERSIVSIETLKETNANLITTLDEVLKIQEEGKAKRIKAETELRQIEDDLKLRLMQVATK